MYTKAKIFNLALGALLLQKRISDPTTDTSNENKVLETHYDVAFRSTIEDLDLDSMSTEETLALVTADPTALWLYAYLYPANCSFFRRIQSTSNVDNRTTHIPKRISIYQGQKVIFTNEEDAIGEFIPHDISLSTLSANAGLAIAYRLAILSAPLVVGKGSLKLRESIEKQYILAKGEAQEQDRRENFSFNDESIDSEFVEARLE